METITKLHNWKQTRMGQIITGVAEGVLAYIFASLAIDTASWWYYLLTLLFVVGTVQNFVKAISNNGKN